MSNPDIKATTPLEEILKITSKTPCDCRDTHCCLNPPPTLFDEETQRILDYLGIEVGGLDKLFDKQTIFFREWYIPIEHQSLCIFVVRKKEKQAQLEEIKNKLRKPKTTKEKIIEAFQSFRYWFVGGRFYCGIQEIKPIECRIYHCRNERQNEITSWIYEYYHADGGDQRTIKELREYMEKCDLPILEGSVLQE